MRLIILSLCLLATQVQAQQVFVNSYVFFSTASTLNTGLVSYWKLDELSGTRFDSEPTATVMDLTDNNTVTNAVGKIGNCALFVSANSEFLSHADSTELSRGDFDWTVVAWSKAVTLTAGMTIASQWSTTPSQQRSWRLWFNSGTGKYTFSVSPDGIASTDLADTNFGTPVTNVWNMHVIIHDSVNDIISIQTNLGTPNTAAYATGIKDSTSPFDIGARGIAGADFANMYIDEVGMWNKVLTPAEIVEIYNLGNGKTCCPFAP